MRKIFMTIACLWAGALGWTSCVDTEALESKLTDLEGKAEALEQRAAEINSNAISAYKLITEGQIVMEVNAHDNGTVYSLELSDGSTIDIYLTENDEGITPIVGVDEDGNWIYSVDGGSTFMKMEATGNTEPATVPPQIRVNDDSVWEFSTDGGITWTEVTDADGNKVPANTGGFSDSFFESVKYDETNGKLVLGLATGEEVEITVSQALSMTVEGYEEGMAISAGTSLELDVTFSEDVTDAVVMAYPDGWRIQITEEGKFIITPSVSEEGEHIVEIWLQSAEPEKYIRKYRFSFVFSSYDLDPNACNAWKHFVEESEENVLLDFSYAGYDHGNTAPAEVTVTEHSDGTCSASNGYKVYNIKSYKTDGNSYRQAFLEAVKAATGQNYSDDKNGDILFGSKNQANAIVYFPEGDYVLHSEADNKNGTSQSIIIRAGNFILKGAGADKTRLIMEDPNLPDDENVLYSSPDMIQLKHNTGIKYDAVLANVTGEAAKGEFSVEVGSTSGLKEGDWVCLYLKNKDIDLVTEELAPYYVNPSSDWVIVKSDGVIVKDIHQIAEVSGNTVTFHEPIMPEVDPQWGWQILRYDHYENVGVEDLTFVGNAKESFDHQATWKDDGAYKPISMTRAVNSWMRRVNFKSVSEACSIIESANVSVYDCEISGNRGHSSIRSQGSSRVFIGGIRDIAQGCSMDEKGHDVTGSDPNEVTGQYHAVGVSKESMGAVLWRNTWGSDGCFEAHASQPRATLIDCCEGSFRRWRQGGDENQMPNHLADLTIWNFENATSFSGTWIWWDQNDRWWKFLPPVVVGFHGHSVTFDETQTKYMESNGTSVQPESLYEEQLKKRLGYVPGWLLELKAKTAN